MSTYVIEEHNYSGKPEIVGRVTGTRKQARVLRNKFRKATPGTVYHERWIGP